MKKIIITLAVIVSFGSLQAQKKVLDQNSFDIWQSLKGSTISNDGKWIAYYMEAIGGGDPVMELRDSKGTKILSVERGSSPEFSFDSKFLVFTISPFVEELKDLRRSKVKKDKLPKDTIAIYNLKSGELAKVPRVKSYKVPEKWSGWIACLLEAELSEKDEKDTTSMGENNSERKKSRKENNENGYRLVIRNLETASQDTFRYVKDYIFAEEGERLSFVTTGDESSLMAGVYSYNFIESKLSPVFRSKGKYNQLTWDVSGQQLAFIADLDTTKVQIRPSNLHYWRADADTAKAIAYPGHPDLPDEWIIGSKGSVTFSKDGSRLYFGTAPRPLVMDTTLLEEEMVNVEIWNYLDGRLHTQQKVQKEDDLNKTHTAVFQTSDNSIVQLGNISIPNIRIDPEVNATVLIGSNDTPYQQLISWEGGPAYNDLYTVDVTSGKSELFAQKVRGRVSMSPQAKYAYWYDRNDSAWFTYSIQQKKTFQVTTNKVVPFFDEINDRPDFPSPYGVMSWTENDEKILIYDRFDIWEIDPQNRLAPVNLTKNGRNLKRVYRYIKLDDEERYISPKQKLLLSAFNETDKKEGVYSFTYGSAGLKELITDDFSYRRFIKSKNADRLIFTKESYEVFPDILSTDISFKSIARISNANPQQVEYNWGTAELYTWTSLDGIELEGMLFKPDNFDPNKKYPMIVNFYEKSSNSINRHRSPTPPRSSISYSIYLSRGYVIFNPNINYRIGYPGESAYNCVVPGVTSLIDEGFIDKERIGLQGHSWGGYQISYIVTQTDLFACAEAGAPVSNMTSAYGGIRWGSGMSRMFQYEHTQSRIGGTLWEFPLRYIENSPIFFVDKINTPLMYMHNDADTAVPWYQGIELFVALRRLGKPVWMLNYQGEPHGLGKMQNKKDFGLRMLQFFDHYLMDTPKPGWMEHGIPATDVGIDQHFLPADH